MRMRMPSAILTLFLILVLQQAWGQEYNCFQCMIFEDCFLCLMFQPNGGLTCYTPACKTCVLQGT